MDKAVIIVSIDLELAWGFNYELLNNSEIALRYLSVMKERSRKNVRKLIKISESYNIPFTWGIVGHLFLTSCHRGDRGFPHQDMPRPRLDIDKDWYSNDPCLDINAEPLWYGPDLIRMITESKIEHEIACHTFSHVDFSHCSREVALSEIRKSKSTMKDFAEEPRTFIFPGDNVGHLDILKQEDFRVFRCRIKPKPRPLYRSLRLFDLREIIVPELVKPFEIGGLIGVPWSLFLQSRYTVDTIKQLMVGRMGINAVVNKNGVFHIAMHDYLESDYLLYVLSNFLSHVAGLIESKKLVAETIYQACSK